MVDRYLPLSYNAVSQAKRDAEAIASLKILMKLDEIKQRQREQLEKEEIARRLLAAVDPGKMGSFIMGGTSPSPRIQSLVHPPPPPALRLPNGVAPTAMESPPLLPSDATNALPIHRIENLLYSRNNAAAQLQASPEREKPRAKLNVVPPEGSLSSNEEEQDAYGDIKAERVRAALLSQPQRGKKRSNLSSEERLELTKTRNREHARNTRLRKKVRHNELVKSERQLKPLLKLKNLEKERLQCLERFIAARQDMLNAAVVALQQDGASVGCGDAARERLVKELLIEPLESFRYETKGLSFTTPPGEDSAESYPISNMRHWDQQLRWKVMESGVGTASAGKGNVSSTFFAYELQEGVDGIAISKSGSSFCQLDLAMYQTVENKEVSTDAMKAFTRRKTNLATILLKARFNPMGGSPSRLSGVEWTVLEDHCGLKEPQAPSPFQALVAAAASKSQAGAAAANS